VVLIVDETADAKSSADCAGAACQYSGGIALCQVAVTLTCATPAGHALAGRALYLPADWAADGERRELAASNAFSRGTPTVPSCCTAFAAHRTAITSRHGRQPARAPLPSARRGGRRRRLRSASAVYC